MKTFEAIPDRLEQLAKLTLKSGNHADFERGVCAMEAVAWLAGEPHSDKPKCACPVISAFMIRWNDRLTDDELRTRLLRPLIPLLIGTRSNRETEKARGWLAVDWSLRDNAPRFLRLIDLNEHADALTALSPLTSKADYEAARPTIQAARKAAWEAREAAWKKRRSAADADAYADAAYAAYADAYAAADAAYAYADAAYAADAADAYAAADAADAAYAAAYAADADAADAASKRDRFKAAVDDSRASAQDLVRRMCALTVQ